MKQKSDIPLIDLTQLRTNKGLQEISAKIKTACLGSGFFMVSNHGIDEDLLAAVFRANRCFHNLPLADKNAIKLNHWHRGYQGFATSTLVSSARFAPAATANQLASFFIRQEVSPEDPDYLNGALKGPNQWPDDPKFREVVSQYDSKVRALGHRLLPAFALAVGESAGFFQTYFENATTALRLIHYPSVELLHSGDALGIQPHTDYGFITILAQDAIFGLEIRLPDGGWMPVPSVPGALIINIGDALARWTNDVFNSTPHRVISPLSGIGRYSVAMFFDPNMDASIRCLRKFIDTDHPAQYPAIQYGNYIAERLNKNYPDRAAGQVPS